MKTTRKRTLAVCLSVFLLASGSLEARSRGGHPTPYLVFEADKAEYLTGEKAQLSWASTNTRHCSASGDWEGKFKTDGVFWTPPLDGPKTFSIKCAAKGGGIESTVAVAVAAPVPDEPDLPPEEPDLPPEEPDLPPEEPDLPPPPVPTVAFSAAATEVAGGSSTTLQWSSTDAVSCEAGIGWSGSLGADGSQVVWPTGAGSTYSLTCSGDGGSASADVQVAVVPPPTVTFAASDSEVNSGGSTTLSWSATNAGSCQADGGWTGGREPTGSELVGPINGSTTFSLTCTGTGGNAMQMVSVSAAGDLSISWVSPEENVDGTPLTDLARYRIYYGTESRSYSSSVEVTDPAATSHAFRASSGQYFVTMTALDMDGNESSFSNEILRSVP